MIKKNDIIDIQKEIVRKWNEGKKNEARRLWRDVSILFSPRVNCFFKKRLKIEENEVISKEMKNLQKIFGGKILNQYGEYYQEDKKTENVGKGNSKENNGLAERQGHLFLEKQ